MDIAAVESSTDVDALYKTLMAAKVDGDFRLASPIESQMRDVAVRPASASLLVGATPAVAC